MDRSPPLLVDTPGKHIPRSRLARRVSVLAALSIALFTACGANDGANNLDLSPAAAEGREVFRSKGCAACHGANGEGGVGPSLAGLFGSEVRVQDQGTIVADRDYVIESIVDPSAKLSEGYNLPMPASNLSEQEIEALVAYIEALSAVEP